MQHKVELYLACCVYPTVYNWDKEPVFLDFFYETISLNHWSLCEDWTTWLTSFFRKLYIKNCESHQTSMASSLSFVSSSNWGVERHKEPWKHWHGQVKDDESSARLTFSERKFIIKRFEAQSNILSDYNKNNVLPILRERTGSILPHYKSLKK